MKALWNLTKQRGRGASKALPSPDARRRLSLSRSPDHLYAIGDVHGCLRHLMELENAIARDTADKPGTKMIVLLGDYIDRGPSSADVIEYLLGPAPAGFHRVCLCGNHEAMLHALFDAPDAADVWLQLGGVQTMFSYGYDVEHLCGALGRSVGDVVDEFLQAFPPDHLRFLSKIAVSLSTPDFVMVHAGVQPGVAFDDQTDHDLMWIRDSAMDGHVLLPGKTVIHGHTPRSTPLATTERIAIDTKAYAGGPLTAVRLGGSTPFFLQVQE